MGKIQKLHILIVSSVLTILFIIVFIICVRDYKEKKAEEKRIEINKLMAYDKCMDVRDSVLKVFFPGGFWIKEQVHEFKKDVQQTFPYFLDSSSITITIGKKKYYCSYSMQVHFDTQTKTWDLRDMHVWDRGSLEDIIIVKYGEKKYIYNGNITKETNNVKAITVNDDDLYKIEDALQREWDVVNISSPAGAESSNVFNLKVKSIKGNEVNVNYSLRSTFNGTKKFVDLDGTIKKTSNGNWEVVSLGC